MIKDFNLDNINSFINAEDIFKAEIEPLGRHVRAITHKWAFTLWKGDEVTIRPRHVIDDNEKLLKEWADDLINGTNKSPDPLKFEPNENVILIQGMKESIDRDFGLVSTKLDWASIGNSNTSEDEIQTDLIAEFSDTAYSRKVFSTQGSQQRVNQTGKLGMLWDDTSFDATPRVIREAGVHWHLTNSNACHCRVVSTDFTLDAGDLFVSQISELQQNGTL